MRIFLASPIDPAAVALLAGCHDVARIVAPPDVAGDPGLATREVLVVRSGGRRDHEAQGLPWLGVGCRNDDVLEAALRLFASVPYRGFAYLEMKRDDRTGQHFAIEASIGRPTGRAPIAEAAGWSSTTRPTEMHSVFRCRGRESSATAGRSGSTSPGTWCPRGATVDTVS